MKVPAYFERELAWDKAWHDAAVRQGKTPPQGLTMPTKENAERWASKIHCALSPENLTCDGELPRSQVAKKAKELNQALAYLENLVGHELAEQY